MRFQTFLLCLLALSLNQVEGSRRRGVGISKKVYEKLKNVKNTTAFIAEFITKRDSVGLPSTESEKKAQEVENLIFTRKGNVNPNGASQVSGMIAKNDACEPKMSSVEIEQSDPSSLLWPSCTKLNQCAGCCGSDIFACTPTKKTTVSLQVLKCKPTSPGSDNFNVVGVETMDFEEHLECECQCKTKVSDCNLGKQDYLPHECKCKCRNEAEAVNCRSPKKWDDKTCGCVCKEVYKCHQDESFSHSTCRCEIKSGTGNTGSSGSTLRNPCNTLTCRAGYIKQPYNGYCRCIVAPSIQIRAGRNRPRIPARSRRT